MKNFLLKRFLISIPTILGVMILVTLFVHLLPGNPVDLLAGPMASGEEKARLAKELHLDQPLYAQVFSSIGRLLQGDLGTSLLERRPVKEMILERVRPTLELALISIMVAMMLGIPAGIISALYRRKFLDYFVMGISILGVSIPNFWFGPLLILFFSLKLGILPVSERGEPLSYILPTFALGSHLAAILARMTRASVLENLQEDYVRTARAKGLPEDQVILEHVLRNSLLPVVTLIGLQFGVLLTGAIITEKIFDWPGLGQLIVKSIETRDYPLVQGLVLVFSLTYVGVNLMTDLIYCWIDPRIQAKDL